MTLGRISGIYWSLSLLLGLMLLYPTLRLHELTHYAFSLLWADELDLVVSLGPESAVYASWHDDAAR